MVSQHSVIILLLSAVNMRANLFEIDAHIATDNPRAAARFLEAGEHTISSLGDHSKRGARLRAASRHDSGRRAVTP